MNPCIECRNCKQELQPSFKHCPICGESVIQETVVSCPNYKNGKPCGRTLKPASKFCGGCRWKVHPKIFIPGTKVCGVENDGTVCINIIEPDEDFCTECGTDVQRRIDTEDVDMEDVSADIDSSLSANKEDQPLFEQKVQYMVQPAKSEYGDDTTANKNLFSEHREESKKQHQEITTDFEDMSTNLGNIAVSNQQDTSHVDSSVIELERNNSIGTFVSSDQNLSASIRETTLESQNGLQNDAQDAEEDLKGKTGKHESSVDHTCGIGRDDGTSLGSTIGLNGTKVFPDSTTDPTCTTGPDVALTGTSENTGTNSTIDPIDTKGTDGTMSGNDDTTGTKGNTDPTDTKGTDGTTGIDDTTGTKGNTDPTDTKGTDGTMSGNDDTTGTKGNTDPIDTKGTDGTMSGNYDTTGTKGNTDPIDTKGTDGTMSGIDDTTGTKGNTDPTDTKGTDGTTGIDNTKGTKGNTDPTDTKGTDDTTGTDSTTGHTSTKDHVGTKDSNGNASVSSFKETDKVDNKNPPSSNGATPDTPVTMNNGSEPKAYGATPDSIDNEKAPIRCTSSDESDNASTDESDAESVQSNPSENPANQKTTGISKPKHKKMTGKEKRKADYEKKKERQSEKEKLKGKENMEAFDLKDQPQKKKDSLKKSLNGTSHEDKGADTSPGKGKQGDILETKHDGQETQKQNEKHGSNEKDKKKNSNPSEKESKSNTRKAHGGRGRQHTTVDVHFHAIASKKFLPKPDECKIYIRIHHADFGNGDLSHPMQIKRNLGKDGHEVYALIKVPQYMIKNGDAISYRYTVVEKGNTENKEDEFYYMNGKKHLRKILLSEDRRKKDVDFWHQYDGVIRKSPDNSKWKQFTDYFRGNTYEDSLKGDAELTITTFLPGLCSLSETVEKSCSPKEGFDIMEMLHCGIKTNYHYTTKIWFSLRDMTKFIGEVVYGCLKKSRKWSEIESGKSSEFVSAACVLLLHHKLDIDLSEAEKVGLCKCLHIDINPTEKQCPTWETFLQYFKELKSEVKPALHNLLRIGGETRDPGWLHCVPLWHFLSGKCKPFEDIPKDCTHDAPTPKWWGIDDLTKEIDFFKAKTHWTMSAANMAGILRPTFQADYLMSRTFVAVLKFENLDEIFKTRFFPPEVLLASLYYHLKTHHYMQWSEKQSFMSLFHHLNDQLRDYQQKAETSSGECSLFNQSFICQKIGCDIVFLCLDNTWTYDKDLTCLAIVCCMLSLNYFNLCCKMRAEETKEKNKQPDKSRINRLDHIKKRILRWLKEKNSFFYNAKNELKIWNNIASVDFTNGVIIDCWKKEILKALEDTLTEKCMEKELMGLYCTNLDDFSKDVQAILSRVTLKALEKGAKLDLNLMNLDQALEYGRMLSQLLERNWPTSQDPTDILKFTLTWPPLIDFLRIFYDNVDKLQILSEVCQSHLSNAANVLKETLEILTNGNIRIAEFNIVQNNVTVFIEACRKLKIVDIKGQQLEEHVTKLVQIRDTEFRTFQEMHVHVSNLIALCQHFEVNTGRLDQVMLYLQPVETVPLSSLCLPGDVTRILALDTYIPDIRVFELSGEQLEKCKSLSRFVCRIVF